MVVVTYQHNRIHASTEPNQKLQLEKTIDQILDEYEAENQDNSIDFAATQHIFNAKSYLKQLLWLIVIVVCFGCCIYQTYDRVVYYLSEPNTILIEMKQFKVMNYPTIVICTYYSNRAKTALEKLANSRKTYYCNLDFLDLLNFTKLLTTVESVWKKTTNEFDITVDGGKNSFSVPSLNGGLNVSTIDLPQGRCVKYEISSDIKYSGTLNSLIIESAYGKEDYCKEVEFQFYNPQLPPNPTRLRRFPFGLTSSLKLEQKRYLGRNTKSNPCININESAACSYNCYENEINKKTPCWLPFMKLFNNSVPCNNTDDAKETQKKALDIYQNLSPTKHCKCIRACEQIYFNGDLESPQIGKLLTPVYIVYYPENLIENLKEVEAYSFIKLVCDVGGNLGLYLGLSLLSIADALQYLFDSIMKVDAVKKLYKLK